MRYAARTRRLILLSMLLTALAAGGCTHGHRYSAGGVVTIRMADWGGADPAMETFQAQVAAEWKRLHPNIAIVTDHIPGSGEYVPKMLTEFVAGTEPDIMTLDASSAAAFIDNDTLRDLTPLVKRDNLDLGVYFPNVLAMARRGARCYALPADFTPMMVYYNKRLFDRAGLRYPVDGWTWNEFLADCRRLTIWKTGTPHPSQYGFFAENWMPGWIAWIWQNGGDVLTPDGRRAEGAMDSPAAAEAVQFFADLVRGRFAPSLSQAQAQGANPFQSGLVAMEVSGHWNIVGLKASETIKLSDVGVVGLPRRRRRVTAIYESGYAITSRCRHLNEAWEVVKFLSGPYVQAKKAELGIGISANRHVANSRRGASEMEPIFLDNVPYGIVPWGARVENYAQVEDIGKEMMDSVLVGGAPVPAALHDAAVRIDAELGPQ